MYPGLIEKYHLCGKLHNMLTWRTVALRCTVNSLHSWYKIPSTLTTYHTAYLFSFTLPWYVAYSRLRISSKFNYVERGLYKREATGNSHVQSYDATKMIPFSNCGSVNIIIIR